MVTVAVGDVDARQPPPPSLDPVGQHVHLVVGGQRVDEDRVVDVPATFDQTDALADWVESKGRRLTHIYITHGHGDHWLGLARMIQRFPGATGLATAEVLARVEFEAGPGMAGYWEGIFPGEVPTGADKVLPQLLPDDTIDLEGNELRVIRIGQADTAESTVLHVPSLAAVVTGDLAYNEVHMMTAETGDAERAQWIANLDEVGALNPAVVVAGHKKVENGNDPKIIAASQQYLRDSSRIVAEETTAAAIVARKPSGMRSRTRRSDWPRGSSRSSKHGRTIAGSHRTP
jgi:glyoxylase-like metal-dependent hydrolase (beta-lactamase superfamily II)